MLKLNGSRAIQSCRLNHRRSSVVQECPTRSNFFNQKQKGVNLQSMNWCEKLHSVRASFSVPLKPVFVEKTMKDSGCNDKKLWLWSMWLQRNSQTRHGHVTVFADKNRFILSLHESKLKFCYAIPTIKFMILVRGTTIKNVDRSAICCNVLWLFWPRICRKVFIIIIVVTYRSLLLGLSSAVYRIQQ